jgi:hypothetical protein
MIIRPVCSREFVALPNALLNDYRLSIETRGMLAYLISRPKNWQIRPIPLARALSKSGNPLGRTKLARMFREAEAAGYIARSNRQGHKENGDFATYAYVVGMPDDVSAALAAKEAGVTSLPQSRIAHTRDTIARNVHRSHKRQKEETQILKIHPQPLPARVDTPQVAEDTYTAFGYHEHANGMQFVFEGSRPFLAWLAFRGEDGMPQIDIAVIGGRRRRGCWFPSIYPRQERRPA